MYKLLLYVILLLFCQCKRDHSLKEEVTDLLRTEIVIRGDKALAEEPVTITAYRAERSAGGIHDFYSEGDYWWPNPNKSGIVPIYVGMGRQIPITLLLTVMP